MVEGCYNSINDDLKPDTARAITQTVRSCPWNEQRGMSARHDCKVIHLLTLAFGDRQLQPILATTQQKPLIVWAAG